MTTTTDAFVVWQLTSSDDHVFAQCLFAQEEDVGKARVITYFFFTTRQQSSNLCDLGSGFHSFNIVCFVWRHVSRRARPKCKVTSSTSWIFCQSESSSELPSSLLALFFHQLFTREKFEKHITLQNFLVSTCVRIVWLWTVILHYERQRKCARVC